MLKMKEDCYEHNICMKAKIEQRRHDEEEMFIGLSEKVRRNGDYIIQLKEQLATLGREKNELSTLFKSTIEEMKVVSEKTRIAESAFETEWEEMRDLSGNIASTIGRYRLMREKVVEKMNEVQKMRYIVENRTNQQQLLTMPRVQGMVPIIIRAMTLYLSSPDTQVQAAIALQQIVKEKREGVIPLIVKLGAIEASYNSMLTHQGNCDLQSNYALLLFYIFELAPQEIARAFKNNGIVLVTNAIESQSHSNDYLLFNCYRHLCQLCPACVDGKHSSKEITPYGPATTDSNNKINENPHLKCAVVALLSNGIIKTSFDESIKAALISAILSICNNYCNGLNVPENTKLVDTLLRLDFVNALCAYLDKPAKEISGSLNLITVLVRLAEGNSRHLCTLSESNLRMSIGKILSRSDVPSDVSTTCQGLLRGLFYLPTPEKKKTASGSKSRRRKES